MADQTLDELMETVSDDMLLAYTRSRNATADTDKAKYLNQAADLATMLTKLHDLHLSGFTLKGEEAKEIYQDGQQGS
jgi:hypothetical protein